VRWNLRGLVAGILLAPGILGAAPGGVVSPSSGERLVSGSIVEVRWEALPADAVEGELLLTIDGPANVSLRVGPRLDPSARSSWWAVPAVPARSARLRLRAGFAGREVECAPGGSFEIVARPGSAPSSFLLREAEWWVAEEAFPVSRIGSSRTYQTFDGEDSLAALLEDSDSPGEVSAESRFDRATSLSRTPHSPRGRPEPSLPLSIPLRE